MIIQNSERGKVKPACPEDIDNYEMLSEAKCMENEGIAYPRLFTKGMLA
jgi:hypothetical protein